MNKPAKTAVGPALSAFYSGFTGNNLNIYIGGKPMADDADLMDWAELVCFRLDAEQEGLNFNFEGVATALRKARADGEAKGLRRAAAAIIETPMDCDDIATAIRQWADALDPPIDLTAQGN